MQTVWIEIPVKNIERATQFYAHIFEVKTPDIADDGVRRTAIFTDSGVGLSLNQTANFEPSDKGPLVYLQIGDDLTAQLARVQSAGGTIIAPKTTMGAAGFYAMVKDTEGNVFALYSAN